MRRIYTYTLLVGTAIVIAVTTLSTVSSPNSKSTLPDYYTGKLPMMITSDMRVEMHSSNKYISIDVPLSVRSQLSAGDILYSNMTVSQQAKVCEDMDRNRRLVDESAPLRAFRETFTSEELTSIQNSKLLFFITYNSYGRITNMGFGVRVSPEILAVPPIRWNTLYEKLKQYVVFRIVTPPPFPMNHNFSWDIVFKNVLDNQHIFPPSCYAPQEQSNYDNSTSGGGGGGTVGPLVPYEQESFD